MSFYKPCIIILVQFLFCMLNALAFPLTGAFNSVFQYNLLLWDPKDTPMNSNSTIGPSSTVGPPNSRPESSSISFTPGNFSSFTCSSGLASDSSAGNSEFFGSGEFDE